MKKSILRFLATAAAVALIVVPVTAADNGTGNVFTVTDIPGEYEGKFVFLMGEDEGGADFAGFQSHDTETETISLPVISNGQVVIPMWDNLGADDEGRWAGNGTVSFLVEIVDVAEFSDTENLKPVAEVGFLNVAFTGGNTTMSFNDAVDTSAN